MSKHFECTSISLLAIGDTFLRFCLVSNIAFSDETFSFHSLYLALMRGATQLVAEVSSEISNNPQLDEIYSKHYVRLSLVFLDFLEVLMKHC